MNKQDSHRKQALFWLEYSQQLSTAIRYEAALAAVEKAIELDKANGEAWYVKGTCFAMLAKYSEALVAFEQALHLDNQYVPAWDGKAWVLGILGKKNEALVAVNRALELDPSYYQAILRKERIEAMS